MQTVVTPSRIRALALLLLGALWLQPTQARAFDLEGATIKMELELPDSSGDYQVTTDIEKIKDHFGLANCVCGDTEFGMKFSLETPPASFANSEPVEVWLGSSCDAAPENITVRNDNCESPKTYGDIEDLISTIHDTFPVHSLLAPNSEICAFDTGTQQVWAIIDEGTDGIDGEDIAVYYDIPYDTDPPPAPTNIRGAGAEEAIQLRWDLPSASEEVRYFQVLCARADGIPSESDGFPGGLKPQFLTSQMVCGADIDGVHPVTPTGEVAADLPASLFNLDTATLCGEVTGSQVGVRIEGLENEVPYRLVLLAVDDYRNVTALDLGEHTPKPVIDGWEYYESAGGHADGGFCFVATATYGNYDHPFVRILRNFRDDSLAHTGWGRDFIAWYYANSPGLAGFIAEHESARFVSYVLLAPLVSIAAIWEYTGPLGKLALLFAIALLFAWRRHGRRTRSTEGPPRQARPRRAVLVALTTLLVLLGVSASAQAQPYWDELNEPIDHGDSTPNWNVDVKFGPYYPEVDDEFNLNGDAMGPFEEVYGDNANLMTIVSLDRFFSFPAGQLGVTGSVGFSKQYANAFEVDGSGNPVVGMDGKFQRSSGDKTKFRLIPTSIGAVYRFTKLDDDYGIPLVPYGKASLSYYVWWFTAPSGELSRSSDGHKARGGSLGYQGSLGLALRAERIDPGAEVSLRTEMGIEHAGFFAEVQMAKVDGFGADDKLSVGDTTWFGGINFEF